MNQETVKADLEKLDGKMNENLGKALDIDQLKSDGKTTQLRGERDKAAAKSSKS